MSGELLAPGDPLPHVCTLPPIPTETFVRFVGREIEDERQLVNAVARCPGCGRLCVSREYPDGWGRVVRWVPLRWWHRRAIGKLRARLTPEES